MARRNAVLGGFLIRRRNLLQVRKFLARSAAFLCTLLAVSSISRRAMGSSSEIKSRSDSSLRKGSLMSTRIAASIMGLAATMTAAADGPRHVDLGQGTAVKTLAQNWTDDESNWFYNVAQGSRLLPYDWFLH